MPRSTLPDQPLTPPPYLFCRVSVTLFPLFILLLPGGQPYCFWNAPSRLSPLPLQLPAPRMPPPGSPSRCMSRIPAHLSLPPEGCAHHHCSSSPLLPPTLSLPLILLHWAYHPDRLHIYLSMVHLLPRERLVPERGPVSKDYCSRQLPPTAGDVQSALPEYRLYISGMPQKEFCIN